MIATKHFSAISVLLLLFTLAAVPALAQGPPRTAQITASYTDKVQYDVYEVNATAGAVTLTLQAPAKRRTVVVVKTDSTVNAVTVVTAGTGATINGASSYVLTGQHASAVFVANGRSGSNGVWRVASETVDDDLVRYAEVSISSANITGTSAGQLGHAAGYPLLSAPGAGRAIEVLSAVVIFDYATAAYTDGGNVTVNYAGGGAALTAAVSAANSLAASADKIALLLATTPTNNQLAANTGVNLVAAAAFTQPGTAAGVVRVKLAYRVHTTGL